jgi:hypothetical protein
MFKVPEQYRQKSGKFLTDSSHGNNGLFYIPLKNRFGVLRQWAQVFADDKNNGGFEHISIVITTHDKSKAAERSPSKDEIAAIKNIFWGTGDIVVQFHVPETDGSKYAIHLFRKIGSIYEIPSYLVSRPKPKEEPKTEPEIKKEESDIEDKK